MKFDTEKSDTETKVSSETENKSGFKRQYRQPNLVEYGSLRDLTQFGGSNAADFFGNMAGGGGMGMGMN